MADHSRRLNGPYLKRLATGRPYVTAKWAMTLDGKIAGDTRATAGGSPGLDRGRWSTKSAGGWTRSLVGIGTALADDPMLTARPSRPSGRHPGRARQQGRLPLDGQLARSAREVPVLVAVTDASPGGSRSGRSRRSGCELLRFPRSMARSPSARSWTSSAAEGSRTCSSREAERCLGAFLDSEEVDEVDVFLAPIDRGRLARFLPGEGRLGRPSMAEALAARSPRGQHRRRRRPDPGDDAPILAVCVRA